jgi:two-component system, chemotaxis family, protein-glutamate methylesterase/glutaminase
MNDPAPQELDSLDPPHSRFDGTAGRFIVVVGASAGGVEALKTFVGALPHDLPAAVFVVLHVWPSAKSFLPAILERVSRLPVSSAVDGQTIELGRVYVAQPDYHLFVRNGKMAVLRGPRENRCRPAINPLFRSAAATYGDRVIGIVLTGTMDDGASGLWAIKQGGGVAIVQDPADAAFQEMPQNALESVEVDHCVPINRMAETVVQRVRETVLPRPPNPVPKVVNLSNQGAQMAQLEMKIDEVGKRSVFSCPECSGALWELEEGGQLTYRCHVGHAYSARNLSQEQASGLEQSLWSALRALVESATLDERLAKRSEEAHLSRAAEIYRRSASEKKEQEKHIRHFLESIRPAAPPAEETAAG